MEESGALSRSLESDSGGVAIPAQRSGGSDGEPHWSGLRAVGDRWAAVRSDDRGRELRMGERRAEVRADGSGTELRIEDRWAAVRREDARRSGDSDRAETRRERREREEAWSPEIRPGRRRAEDDDEPSSLSEPARDRRSTPALPSGGEPVPSWASSRSDETPARRDRDRVPRDRDADRARDTDRHRDADVDRESRASRRRREDADDRWEREPTDPGRAAARPRRLDFELTDDRWR